MQRLPRLPTQEVSLPRNPTEDDVRAEVRRWTPEMCGRRIAEEVLVPYILASPDHDDADLALAEQVLAEEFEGSELCLETRAPECSRLRGGCKGER